jgi:hypothetical protein
VTNGIATDLDRRMERLRTLRRLLDEVFRVPGTNFRFGWDPVIGLVPGIGDLVAGLYSCAILFQAHRMRIPAIVQLRMLMNVGIDVLMGIVPIVGDVADAFWKSSTRNFRLLERHAGPERPPTRGDWLFVIGVVTVVLMMAAVPFLVLIWLFTREFHLNAR